MAFLEHLLRVSESEDLRGKPVDGTSPVGHCIFRCSIKFTQMNDLMKSLQKELVGKLGTGASEKKKKPVV